MLKETEAFCLLLSSADKTNKNPVNKKEVFSVKPLCELL